MRHYDIFKSEGGYRVGLAYHGDGPIIDHCPWFETEAQAKAHARYVETCEIWQKYGLFKASPGRWVVGVTSYDKLNPDFYDFDTYEEAKEYRDGLAIKDLTECGLGDVPSAMRGKGIEE